MVLRSLIALFLIYDSATLCSMESIKNAYEFTFKLSIDADNQPVEVGRRPTLIYSLKNNTNGSIHEEYVNGIVSLGQKSQPRITRLKNSDGRNSASIELSLTDSTQEAAYLKKIFTYATNHFYAVQAGSAKNPTYNAQARTLLFNESDLLK